MIKGTIMCQQMQIDREVLTELQELQEDVCSHFVDENFPLTGETYWTCVEALAATKLAEFRGELVYND
jgi:hypothetical protein